MNKKSKNSQFTLWSVLGLVMLINTYIHLMQKSYITAILFSISAICFLFAAISEKKNSK